jgi:hypothetical protein
VEASSTANASSSSRRSWYSRNSRSNRNGRSKKSLADGLRVRFLDARCHEVTDKRSVWRFSLFDFLNPVAANALSHILLICTRSHAVYPPEMSPKVALVRKVQIRIGAVRHGPRTCYGTTDRAGLRTVLHWHTWIKRALAPVLYGRLGDAAGAVWATVAAAVTALAVVPLMLVLSPRLTPFAHAQKT